MKFYNNFKCLDARPLFFPGGNEGASGQNVKEIIGMGANLYSRAWFHLNMDSKLHFAFLQRHALLAICRVTFPGACRDIRRERKLSAILRK